MSTPEVSWEERNQRWDLIEALYREGWAPPGLRSKKGSAFEEAARRLGISSGTIHGSLRAEHRYKAKGEPYRFPDPSLFVSTPPMAPQEIQRASARQGWAPDYDMVHPVPDGQTIRGVSTRYDGDGKIDQVWNKTKAQGRDPAETIQLADPKKVVAVSTLYDQGGQVTQQWVKEKPEDVQREALWQAFAEALRADLPKVEPVKGPDVAAADRLACYPVGDHHFGMLAWARETRDADYDLRIAERLLCGATGNLVTRLPSAAQAVIAFLGDLLHYDSFQAVTPTHRNLLDADGRYPKMVDVAIRAMRHMIDTALRHHSKVHVIIEIGNHDLSSMVMLAQSFAHIYDDEPRVTFDTSPSHYHYYEFGANLIGTHHGHGAKLPDLPAIMASDQPEAWGRTKHRYWWTGHIHQKKALDFAGCSVESFRVLPPPDAWAASEGHRPIRGMCAMVLHREHGENERYTVTPPMLLGRPA